LIGHNPGMEQLAIALTLQPTAAERGRAETVSKKFPTCALAVFEFDGGWRDVKPDTGRLKTFVRPKDLDEA
jgi:phosphohistidine phosphatase